MTTGVDCTLRVNGIRMPDGSPGESELDPAALSGLTIEWGRETTVDQPDASTCSFDVIDEAGGESFLAYLRTGLTVDVTASGVITGDPTVSTIQNGDFEGLPVGSVPTSTLSPAGTTLVVTDTKAAPGGTHSARIQAPPVQALTGAQRVGVIIPPAPYSDDPSAWDAIPSTGDGETWSISVDVWALSSAQVTMTPVMFADPSGKRFTNRGSFTMVQGTGGWQTITTSYVVTAANEWIGVDLRIVEIGPDWFYTPGSWLDQIESFPTALAAGTVRTNIVPNPGNGTINGGLAGARGTLSAGAGSTILTITDPNPVDMAQRVTTTGTASLNAISVVPEQSYYVSVDVRSAIPGTSMRAYVQFVDASNVVVGPSTFSLPTVVVNGSTFVTTAVTMIAPPGAARAVLAVGIAGTTPRAIGDTIEIRRMFMEPTDQTPRTYFDGSTPDVAPGYGVPGADYAWTAAANGSPSTSTELAPIPGRRNRALQPYPVAGTGGWKSNNGASYPVTIVTDVVRRPGTSSAKSVRSTATPNNTIASLYGVGSTIWNASGRFPVVPGEVIPVSVWGRVPIPGARATFQAYWWDAAGTALVPASTTPPWVDVAVVDVWTQVASEVTVPAGAAIMGLSVNVSGPVGYVSVGGETTYLQDVMIGPGEYLDGSMPDVPADVGVGGLDYSWEGPVNGSSSTVRYVDPVPYSGPSWLDYSAAFIDNVTVLAPEAGTTLDVLVFSGRITDLTTSYDDGVNAPVVHVTALDFTADLDNVRIGDEPWAVETMAERFNRIVSLSGLPITTLIDSTVADTLISYQDVDSQPATGLLKDLSQSVDAVLWSAVHATTGAYLRVEDPATRASLYRLSMVDGVIVIVESGSIDDAIDLSACDVLRDPVEWKQTVSDVSTRSSVTWQEQGVDDKGKPVTTERTETVVDSTLELDYGVRTISVSTLLQSATDARWVADRILARTSIRDWRASGITIDDDDSLERADAAAVDLLLSLLDGTRRIGQALRLIDLPPWSPAGDDVPVFLEGGRYAYLDGAWTLDLTVSSAVSTGVSLAWDQIDPAWTWIQFDPGISWSDLYGVGPDVAEQRRTS